MKRTTLLIFAILFAPLLVPIAQAAADGEWKLQKQMKLPAKATTLAYSSDGTRLAVGHRDGRVSIWDVRSGASVHLLNAHSKEINSIQFILQDSKLLTIGDDKTARLWSTSDWTELATIEDVAFAGGVSPDGRWLAAQDAKQAIWLWDLSTLKRTEQLYEAGKGGVNTLMFTADAKYIAAAYSTALLINVATKKPVPFTMANDKKTAVNITPLEGNKAAISLGPLQEDDAITHHVIPSRTGSLIALGRGWYGQPAFVDLWDTASMKRVRRLKAKDIGTLTSFSFDNSMLAVEGSTRVTIWNVANGKQVASVNGGGIMQFSPNAMELSVTDGSDLMVYALKP